MNWKEIEPQTIELRCDLLATMDRIKKESQPDNIPDIAQSFELSEKLLARPSYDIVICGEVKKGKSTFINAIIGQELLPTGVKETTSQVFRITNNPTESFSLVFTDGTNEKIARDQLSRFGSQVDADLLGEPIFKNRQLDYIQVNVPIEFLPVGVSIVDTPGLGALYKSHELITNRYVQNAAAVVFIFDPSQPLVQQEKLFLEKVFNVTPFVMFVMTKTDCYDEEHWVHQISRTETLLKDSFGKRCYSPPKVFPVASTTLFDASKEADPEAKAELVDFSEFPAAQAELLKVMYITVGLSRTRFAWSEANKQKCKALTSLEEQSNMIAAETKEEQAKIRDKKLAIRQSFEQLWGPSSTKRNEVRQEVQTIITGVQNRAQQLTSNSGSLYKKYLEQIEAFHSIEQVKSFVEQDSKSIISEVTTGWQAITDSAHREIITTLDLVQSEIQQLPDNDIFSSSPNMQLIELSFSEKFQNYKARYFDVAIASTVSGGLLSILGLGSLVPPLLPIALVGSLVYSLINGGLDAEKKALEKNKANLKNNLAALMNEIHSQLFVVPVAGGHKTMVQSFTSELAGMVDKAMDAMFEQQKRQFETEQKRLDEQGRLSTEQKQKQLTMVNEQRKQWLAISAEIAEEEKIIQHIKRILA